MELPRRSRGDELLRPGELTAIRKRLRSVAPRQDLTTVIACAFDYRTRMLPFILADRRMVPAGVREVGAAMVDSGFVKTRIVLQQWSRRFRPSLMKLDGRIPDLFMVSSMQIHYAQAKALIGDACRIDPQQRPLIIAGGPKAIYEPWDFFSADADDPASADVAVTGEVYVLLAMLEVLLAIRAPSESMRTTFIRARNSGILDDIPGLVFARTDDRGRAVELIDTGIQRLVGDLDEMAHPAPGYRILEPPGTNATLSTHPLSAGQVNRYSPLGAIVLTLGCKFGCPYCPIPAYNQRRYRTKSGERIADEMVRLHREFGLRFFFGADDNFFNDKERTLEIVETLARTQVDGVDLRHRARWGTEVTVHDTLRMKDHLRAVRKAGVRALWLGVEDMTGKLVKKGQSVDKTTEAFRLLRQRGILPMPMMMHHDSQPLYTRNGHYGLLNQVKLLRKAGAISLQVLMITPSPGSKIFDETFTSGMMYESVAGRRVEQYMIDGNYVVASKHEKPWRKQLNILLAYLYFYNPLRFVFALLHPKSRLYLPDAVMQLIGMWGLTHTVGRTFGWMLGLMRGRIRRRMSPPVSRIPMRSTEHTAAAHAIPGTPVSEDARVPSGDGAAVT